MPKISLNDDIDTACLDLMRMMLRNNFKAHYTDVVLYLYKINSTASGSVVEHTRAFFGLNVDEDGLKAIHKWVMAHYDISGEGEPILLIL